jgi:general secretion pathway protein A
MEEIRLLTNLETSTDKLLQVVLSGQPELEEKLRLPQLRQLRQRITLRCKTTPLTQEQTRDYINERLRIAGATGEAIFGKEAVEAVHLYSLGIPRVVNLLCEHSLVNSFVEQKRQVTAKIVEDVAHEFQLDEVDQVTPQGSTRIDQEVYNSETFLQNLGEALSRFRVTPPSTSPRERK